eukprot:6464302-Amphidinium_carterae.1
MFGKVFLVSTSAAPLRAVPAGRPLCEAARSLASLARAPGTLSVDAYMALGAESPQAFAASIVQLASATPERYQVLSDYARVCSNFGYA